MEHYVKTAAIQIVSIYGGPPRPYFLLPLIAGFYSKELHLNVYGNLMHVRTRLPSAKLKSKFHG